MKENKTLNVIISVMLWVVILLAAFFAFVTLATRDQNKVASFMGYTPLTVASDSMKPTFSAGDLILIKKCDPADLEEGDIITFHTIIENEYALNTHRIASIDESNGVRSYVTRGDNNPIEDSHIIADGDIVGKFVSRVPGAGKLMSFLSSSVGFLVVIVVPMLIFFIYQVYHLIMVSISLKKATAIEAAEEKAAAENNAQAKISEAEADAQTKLSEAQAALEEANRLKAELEAKLAEANKNNAESK